MELVRLSSDNKIELPSDIAIKFQPDDRFLIATDGETVLLKKAFKTKITDFAERLPDEEPMSMKEIVDAVHECRRERKSKG
ncbi:MAG: hypothetical protein QME81_01055 [bacterium]|nr:hypothetical protein [bacterium]